MGTRKRPAARSETRKLQEREFHPNGVPFREQLQKLAEKKGNSEEETRKISFSQGKFPDDDGESGSEAGKVEKSAPRFLHILMRAGKSRLSDQSRISAQRDRQKSRIFPEESLPTR